MDISIGFYIETAKVNIQSVSKLLTDLHSQSYVASGDIRTLSFVRYDTKIQDEVGESYSPRSIEDALKTIEREGVDSIFISFDYKNHYGSGSAENGICQLVRGLNTLVEQAASDQDSEIIPNIYGPASFSRNQILFDGYDGPPVDICYFSFTGDGMPIDEDKFVDDLKMISNDSPAFLAFQKLLQDCFQSTPQFFVNVEGT